MLGCGGPDKPAEAAGGRCSGDATPPRIVESGRLSTGLAGGANAWLEIKTTRAEPDHGNNHLFLEGREVPIVRVSAPNADAAEVVDGTGGRLTGRDGPKRSADAHPYVVSFRVPAGVAPGPHELVFKTCDVVGLEELQLTVLPSAVPTITSIRFVRGEWPVLLIKGTNLGDAEEVVVVSSDGAVTKIANLTKIDDSQLRAPLDRLDTYEVFVRTKNGLGGGPPSGVVTVR